MQNGNNLQLGDLIKLEGLEKPFGKCNFKIAAQADQRFDGFNKVAGALEDSVDLKAGELAGLIEAVINPKMDYFGDQLTAEEYTNIAKKEVNERAYEQILAGQVVHKQLLIDLTYLPATVARALVSQQTGLPLRGLTEMSVATARELGKTSAGLGLDGMKVLKPEVAEQLINCGEALALYGLEELSPELAKILVRHQGKKLHMSKVKSLSLEVAAILKNYEGELILRGVENLSLEMAKELAQHQGKLSLSGFVVTPELMRELAVHQGELTLKFPHKIKEELAVEMVKFGHDLSVNDAKEITDQAATILANFKGKMSVYTQIESRIRILELRTRVEKAAVSLKKAKKRLKLPDLD